jgi:YD repeat-containing protein
VLLLAFSACTEDEIAVEFTYPTGKIKKELTYDAPDLDQHARFAKYFYDEDTLLVKEEYFMYPDLKYLYFDKSYDAFARLVRQSQYIVNPDHKTFRTKGYTTFEYDDRGRLSRKESTKDDGSRISCFEYSNLGDTVQIKYNCTNNREERDHTYEMYIYKDGQLMREVYFAYKADTRESSIIYAFGFQYHDGKLMKKYWLNGSNDVYDDFTIDGVYEEYFYNNLGQLTESRRYDPYWGYNLVEKKVYEYY